MSGATSRRTFRASSTTSGPIPSPGTTARRMGTDPRSDGVEVRGPGLPRPDLAGDVAEQLRRDGAVDGDRHEGLPTAVGAAHLGAGDVDAGLAEGGTDRADDAGAVGVDEEQQVAGQVQVHVEPVD